MIISPLRERLQMAGMVAAVAAVSGNGVRVFVSMNALPCFAIGSATPPSEGAVGLLLERDGPSFLQLLSDAVELGDTKIYPCSMAMELLRIRQTDLPDWFGEPLGVTRFLEEVHGRQVWTF